MEDYRTEEEQIEALKRWWSENGKSIVIGIALAGASVFGWRAWQDQQQAEHTGEVLFQEWCKPQACEEAQDNRG